MPVFKLCELIQNHLLKRKKEEKSDRVSFSDQSGYLFFLFLYLKIRSGRSQAAAIATHELVQAIAPCAILSRMGAMGHWV
jgi:hypothetical protein